jgi:Zn-dependent alcohol dehydrogenase
LDLVVDLLAAEQPWQREGLNHAAAISRAAREGDLARAAIAAAGLLTAFGAELSAMAVVSDEGTAPAGARTVAVRALLGAVEAGMASGDLHGARAAARAVDVFLSALLDKERKDD